MRRQIVSCVNLVLGASAVPVACGDRDRAPVLDGCLTDAQESTVMPNAGRAGSHSGPKATDKSASSP